VSESLVGEGFVLRRATLDDLDFMAGLAGHEDVEPFMAAVSARDPDAIREEIEQGTAEPNHHGRFIVEVEGQPAG
jgi:hypothetical protein